ncbi:phosphatase 2C-like domain-containing protein [Syncephalis fuscata]|nr:phosphatase 2C-like domain-containing protein [Syncephalis fuscata]
MSSVHSLANYLRHAAHASASSLSTNRGQSESFREGNLRLVLAVRAAESRAASTTSSASNSPLASPVAFTSPFVTARSPSPSLLGLPSTASAAIGHDSSTDMLFKRLNFRTQPKARSFHFSSGTATAVGKRDKNQDETLIAENLFGQDDCALYAVFDGHGSEGHKAATFVKKVFLEVLENYRQLLIVEPATAIKRAFREVNDLLVENEDVDTYMSGTTASVVIRRGNQLILAHLGDSRVILGRRVFSPSAAPGDRPDIQAISLTSDHNCADPQELDRVLRSGARVQQLQENGTKQGPLRIFKGSLPYPGIVVSRSLGDDVAQRLGVLCEPEVQVRELSPDDCYLILATDGVWDGMSSQEVASFVDNEARSDSGVDASTASLRLNDAALKALDAHQIDDNVSNVCVFIRYN